MLFYKTIHPKTLELLKSIQQIPIFKDLRLVGGTSLSLQIGHRISIDIDLFGKIDTTDLEINTQLKKLGKLKTIHKTGNISIFSIGNVKTYIVNYPYPWIDTARLEDNLILANMQDIAAMKLAAITGRGSKKDFIDLYYLLQQYTLEEMLQFYETKYDDGSKFMVLKSLAYFKDADEELMPKMFDSISWENIKESLKETLRNFL